MIMTNKKRLIKFGIDWGYVDELKPKQIIKKILITVAYLFYGYLGLKMAASQNPEINWLIKLVGLFAWIYIPYWIKENSQKSKERI